MVTERLDNHMADAIWQILVVGDDAPLAGYQVVILVALFRALTFHTLNDVFPIGIKHANQLP